MTASKTCVSVPLYPLRLSLQQLLFHLCMPCNVSMQLPCSTCQAGIVADWHMAQMPCAMQASLLCATQATGCVLCTLIEDLLSWLTGVNDSAMQSAIAATAVQLAGLLQQVISDEPLVPASMWGHTYSTRPWDASTTDATHDSECDGAAMGTVWPHLDKELCYHGMRADTRKLVVVAFELFQSLTS